MAVQNYRHFANSTLMVAEEVSQADAQALASMPGACEAMRYPIFVEMEETYAKGAFARFEFVIPGKPGRWSAAGEVTCEVKNPVAGIPQGVCVELLGLTLTAAPEAADAAGSADTAVQAAQESDEPEVAFDPATLEMDHEEVCGMLADLMGRDVDASSECKLPGKLKENAIVAIFRDDAGEAIFTITFDKAGGARVGGALTMLPEAAMNDDAKSKALLEGEPLENVSEVLNIMSALFHDAGSPHVVLAEVISGGEMRDYNDGEFVPLFDEPRWSLAHGLEIEDYGVGEVYLGAR